MDSMDAGQETQNVEGVVEAAVDASSIAYTVEIRVVDESYGATQEVMEEQHISMIPVREHTPQGGQSVEVMTEASNTISIDPQTIAADQIDPSMLVTFSEGDHQANLHHITVTNDMVGYLPPAAEGVPQSVNTAMNTHHQIIMSQASNPDGISGVKLVDSMSSDPNQSVILMQPQDQSTNQAVHAIDSQQNAVKEMEIASAAEALEALTGLATTFNAWAQQNPQALEASLPDQTLQHPLTEKPKKDKSDRHKSSKHKSKKHKSGKHKKKNSSRRKEKSDLNNCENGTGDGTFKCKVCGRIFGSKLKLKNHMISHSDERPYVCDVCGSAFKRARYLQIHKKSHFSDTLFACMYCDKAYFERKRLRSHEKCHINPFTCEVCGKAYGDKRGLLIHFRTHTNEKPFICRICGRGFTSKAGVNKHERSHSGLKPYVCKICGKAYTQPTNLSDHQRTHINERTFACTSCPKVFLARSSLRRHRVKNHPGEKPNVGKLEPLHTRQRIMKRVTPKDDKSYYKYSCNLCDKKFKKEKYLKKHSKIHTVGTRSCSFCTKSFRDKRDLLNHERRHTGEKPFKCVKCGKAFVSSSAMQRHEKCHLGLRPYICGICNKGFTRTTGLRDHELIHNGKNKRFPCNFNCDKIFASRSALRSHERLKHQQEQQQQEQQQQPQQFGTVVEAPIASMEVPVETDEGDAVSYIKLMFTEA